MHLFSEAGTRCIDRPAVAGVTHACTVLRRVVGYFVLRMSEQTRSPSGTSQTQLIRVAGDFESRDIRRSYSPTEDRRLDGSCVRKEPPNTAVDQMQ